MNFKLFILNLFSRCLGIIWTPKEEWVKISDEADSIGQIVVRFILPLLFISALAAMTGSYFLRQAGDWTSGLFVIAGLRPVLSISVSLLISTLAIQAMLGTFKGTPNVDLAFRLVFFSFIPVVLVSIVLGIWSEIYIAGLFLLYSFYIMFFGVRILTDIPQERQSNFSTLSATVILVVYLIVNFILSSLDKKPGEEVVATA